MQDRVRSVALVLIGTVIGATLLTCAVGQPEIGEAPSVEALPPSGELPPGCLQVVSEPGAPIVAVVYDPQQQVLGVYHVDRATGEIELKSIRQIQWDLQMLHWHGKKPLPADVKKKLEAMRRG